MPDNAIQGTIAIYVYAVFITKKLPGRHVSLEGVTLWCWEARSCNRKGLIEKMLPSVI